MKTRRRVSLTAAFNLIELFLLLVVVCLDLAVLLPMLGGSESSPGVVLKCPIFTEPSWHLAH